MNSYMVVAAYQQLTALVDARTLIAACSRALLSVLQTVTDDAFGVVDDGWGAGKTTATVCSILHGYLVCNQSNVDFCDNFASLELASHFALCRLLAELLHAGTTVPSAMLPLRKILVCLRQSLTMALLGTQSSRLIDSRSAASSSSHPRRDAASRLRTSSSFTHQPGASVGVGAGLAAEGGELVRTPTGAMLSGSRKQRPLSQTPSFRSVGAARRRAWSTESRSVSTGESSTRSHTYASSNADHAAYGIASEAGTPLRHQTSEWAPRAANTCFASFLGTDEESVKWGTLIADLLAVLLAAAPNLKVYTGKVQLFDELSAVSQTNIYDGHRECKAIVGPIPPVTDAARTHSRNRFRDITAKCCSDTLLLLLKAMALGYVNCGRFSLLYC